MDKHKVNIKAILLTLIMTPLFFACTSKTTDEYLYRVTYTADDLNDKYDLSSVETVQFSNDTIQYDGVKATVSDQILTILEAGDYLIEGNLDEGQIIVNTNQKSDVRLIFNNVSITNSSQSPIIITQADKVIITLVENSINRLIDHSKQAKSNDEVNASIYCKATLSINGLGSLNIESDYKHGIHSKDGLKILSATIKITSKQDGIKGKDYVGIKDAYIEIDCDNDGIQSDNATEINKGFVDIENTNATINAGLDAIQAVNSIDLSSGSYHIKSGLSASDNDSGKGLKSGNTLNISQAEVIIDSLDDGIHSNNTLIIDQSNIVVSSKTDALYATKSITLSENDITIVKADEGIESEIITINSGNIVINAIKNGINAVNEAFKTDDKHAQNQDKNDGSKFIFNDGEITINSLGDGIDSNGDILMKSGNLVIYGPTIPNDGAIDYNGTFVYEDGLLIALGSVEMAQYPSSANQNVVLIEFSQRLTQGGVIQIVDQSNHAILSINTTKVVQALVFGSSNLKKGDYSVSFTSNVQLEESYLLNGESLDGRELGTFTIEKSTTLYQIR